MAGSPRARGLALGRHKQDAVPSDTPVLKAMASHPWLPLGEGADRGLRGEDCARGHTFLLQAIKHLGHRGLEGRQSREGLSRPLGLRRGRVRAQGEMRLKPYPKARSSTTLTSPLSLY